MLRRRSVVRGSTWELMMRSLKNCQEMLINFSQMHELRTTQTMLVPNSSIPPVMTSPVREPDEPHIPPLSKYSGDPDPCHSFFTQLRLIFSAQPQKFSQEALKIPFLASLLEGSPLNYINNLFEQDSTTVKTFAWIEAKFKRIYDHPAWGQQAALLLMKFRQGNKPIRQYVAEFRSLAVEAKWDENALITAFLEGLD